MSCAILFFALIFSTQSWASVCEDEMKPVTGILRVLELSLKLGDLTPEQVERTLLNGEFENPFTTLEKSIKNIFFRNTFEKHKNRLRPEQLETLRERVRTLTDHHKGRSKQVDDAREETKYLVFLGLKDSVPLRQSSAGFTQGTLEGRPVFIGNFFDGIELDLYMIDPTNSEATKRTVKLSAKLDEEDQNGGGFFFLVDGRDYFVRVHDGSTYDLFQGRQVKFPLRPKSNWENLHVQKLIFLANHKKIVSSWSEFSQSQIRIKSWSLSGGRPIFETPPPMPETQTPLYISPTAVRAIFGIVPQAHVHFRKILFYDYTDKPKLFATVELQKPEWQFLAHVSPMAYSLRGQWYALALVHDRKAGSYSLAQLDLKSGTLLRTINLPTFDQSQISGIEYQTVNGQPVAVIKSESRVAFLKLTDRKLLWPSPQEFLMDHAFFEWRGETYLIIATFDHHLKIRRMSTGEITAQLYVEGGTGVFTYEQDGIPKALATLSLGRSPVFIDLVHKEEK